MSMSREEQVLNSLTKIESLKAFPSSYRQQANFDCMTLSPTLMSRAPDLLEYLKLHMDIARMLRCLKC